MIEKDNQEDLTIRDLHFQNRHWFIILPFLFLLTALIYLIFAPDKYKVTAKIALSPGITIDDIQSKTTVQKALDQLPLQASYYHKGFFKRTELYGDSLPIKFTFAKPSLVDSNAEVTAKIVDDQLFEVNERDTISSFYFNKPVDYPFAKFKGYKGPAFNKNAETVIIRFNEPDQLLEEYSKKLDIKQTGDDNNTLELSIVTTNPQKGADFLNKLITVSDRQGVASKTTIAPISKNNNAKLKETAGLIASLKIRAEQFKAREVTLKNTQDKPVVNKTRQLSALQLSVLNAIQPYAKSSVNQFVLIPDSYQTGDVELEKLIGQFNEAESAKQRSLQDSQANRNKIIDFNSRIATLKTSILQKIEVKKSGTNNISSTASAKPAPVSLSGLNDSIKSINSQLKAAQLSYTALLANKDKPASQLIAKSGITIIEKPGDNTADYPNTFLVYLFALIAGLIIPLSFPYFRYLNFFAKPAIDLKKLSNRIIEIVHVKESTKLN